MLGTLMVMLMAAMVVLVVRLFFWRARCPTSSTAVLAVRLFVAFSLAAVSATLVEAAERCGLEKWQAVACVNAFRLLVAALTFVIAVLADYGLGSHAAVECGTFLALQGASCYAIAVHQLDVRLLLVGGCCLGMGIGTVGAALLVLGASHYEPGSQDRTNFFHKFFALMALGMILGNLTAVVFWEAGLWVAPTVSVAIGCAAQLLCWVSFTESSPEEKPCNDHARLETSGLSACLAIAGLFIPYYMVQQQAWTSWLLQAKEMDRDMGSAASVAPSAMQLVFYITRTIIAIVLLVVVPMLGKRVPSAKHRCSIAAALSASSVTCSAMLQGNHAGLPVFYQMPQFVLLGIADAIFLPAQSDLFLALAPPGAKHIVSSLAVCSHLVACGFLLLVEPSLVKMGLVIHAGQGMRVYLGILAVISFSVVLVLVNQNTEHCRSVVLLGLPQTWKRCNFIELMQQHGVRARELATDDVTQIAAQCGHDQCDAVLVFDAGLQERLCDARCALVQARVPILVPSAECCEIERKGRWHCWMVSHGFGALLPQRREGEFPCVVKWGNSMGGAGVAVVLSEEELAAEFPDDAVVQRYVFGNSEYAWHFVSLNGHVHWCACVEHCFPEEFNAAPFIKTSVQKGQPQWQSHPSQLGDEEVAKLKRVLESLSFTGAGCIDLKFDIADGSMYIMEMNVRMGGSVVFAAPSCFPEFFDAYCKCIKAQHD